MIGAGILITGLLLAGCGKKTTSSPPSGPPEVGVVVVKPERVALTTELSGRTSPHMIAEVRPQVSGIIQKRVFTEGSDVKAGQVLYQIDPATYQAAYDSAKAAQARAEANLIPARLKEERFRDLVKIKGVSQQEYDDAFAALKQSEADVASSQGGGGNRPDQPGLHQGNGSYFRADRPFNGYRRGAGDRQSTDGAGDHTAA